MLGLCPFVTTRPVYSRATDKAHRLRPRERINQIDEKADRGEPDRNERGNNPGDEQGQIELYAVGRRLSAPKYLFGSLGN